MKKLLLHVCCAPCAIYFLENFNQYQITLFFYNPNIMPLAEYEKRLAEVKKIADLYNLELIVLEYDNNLFLQKIAGLEKEKEGGNRCFICYQLRLEKLKKYLDDYDYFMTTLIISPYKNKLKINQIGQNISFKYLHPVLDKSSFAKSIELSKSKNIYRQKYCGCLFF